MVFFATFFNKRQIAYLPICSCPPAEVVAVVVLPPVVPVVDDEAEINKEHVDLAFEVINSNHIEGKI